MILFKMKGHQTHQTNIVYNPEQNGIVKRCNQMCEGKKQVLCLIKLALISPVKKTVNYCKNRSSTVVANK